MAKKSDKTTRKPAPKKSAPNKKAAAKKAAQKKAPGRKQQGFEDSISGNNQQEIVQSTPSPKPRDEGSDSNENK